MNEETGEQSCNPSPKILSLADRMEVQLLMEHCETRQVQPKPILSLPSKGISVCTKMLPVSDAASTATCLVAWMTLHSINVPKCYSVHLILSASVTFCGRSLHNSVVSCGLFLMFEKEVNTVPVAYVCGCTL